MRLKIEDLENCKNKNLSCADAAKELNCSVSTIYCFCKRNNIILLKKNRGGENVKDITNNVFGSLTVVKRAGSKNRLATWECECKCGKTVIACGSDLRQGKTKTCGCRINVKSRRNWQGYGEIPKTYWQALNNNAERRGIAINTSTKYINKIFLDQKNKCKLSGLPISFKDKSASLDRIDNNKGYIFGNIQWVHKEINSMKGTFTNKHFIELCKTVAENHKRE